MKILADKAIPHVRQLFSTLGEVALADSAGITNVAVRDADCLIVRSVTRVDQNLLEGTRVGCVASASSGVEHVDTDYLEAHNIPLFDAKGCNARAVTEYVLSCLFVLSAQDGRELATSTVGIIGCGYIGGQLQRLLRLLGIKTRVYDPFLRDAHGRFPYRDLDPVLASDIITLHVPLTTGGEYPTTHIVDREFLGRLKQDVILVNTSRGAVINERSLLEFAARNPHSRLALDVWDNEPDINPELLGLATLATPHIAGYSARAKLNATRRVYEQVCAWAGVTPAATAEIGILKEETPALHLSGFSNPMAAISTAALACYDVRTDCAALREINTLEATARNDYFTSLRAGYPLRREFADVRLVLSDADAGLHATLSALGFAVAG